MSDTSSSKERACLTCGHSVSEHVGSRCPDEPGEKEPLPELCGHDDGSHCDESCAEKVRKFRAYHGLHPKDNFPELYCKKVEGQ